MRRLCSCCWKKEANVNVKGGDHGNALSAAGHEKVVRLLLETGANVNAEGGIYGNALSLCRSRQGGTVFAGNWSTLKVENTAPRWHQLRMKRTRRWCNSCWKMGPTWMLKAHTLATRCQEHFLDVTREWCNFCWKKARMWIHAMEARGERRS